MNTCPYPGCDKQIHRVTFACKPHWYTLPQATRNRISANFRSGDIDRILSSYEEAEQIWSQP